MQGMIKQLFTSTIALCGAVVWLAEPCAAAANWQTNMDRVLNTAQAKGRTALVEFTGSDWCPPCIHLRTQVFPTDEFASFVRDKKLLLVELDFPRDASKLPAEQAAHNEKWRVYYDVNSFPSLLVVDGKGAPYGVVNGADKTAAEYLVRLERELNRKAEVEAKLAQAANLQGVERAAAEAEAIQYMPMEWRMLHEGVVQDIIANDPEDTLGYRRFREETALTKEQMQELNKVFSKYSGDMSDEAREASLKEALQLLEDDRWMPVPRLFLNKFISDTYALQRKDIDNVHKYLKAAVESAPESAEGKRLRPWLENLERNMDEIKAHIRAKEEEQQKKAAE